MSEVELTVKGDVQRMELKETDTIVVTLRGKPSPEAIEAITEAAKRAFDHEKVVVLHPDVELNIVGHPFPEPQMDEIGKSVH